MGGTLQSRRSPTLRGIGFLAELKATNDPRIANNGGIFNGYPYYGGGSVKIPKMAAAYPDTSLGMRGRR
jgi:hypothetical protein